MCGIAGIVVSKAGGFDLRSIVVQMQSQLGHRGPDDHGLVGLDNDRCVIAHTRLSILDLSPAGHQPMGLFGQGAGSKEQRAKGKEQRRYWITYNGEIYNYKELRTELSLRGEARRGEEQSGQRSAVHSDWNSNSDTEVLLRAYARWG